MRGALRWRVAVSRASRTVGGPARLRAIGVLAAVLGLDSADKAAIGASAHQLHLAMHIDAFEIGALLAASSVVSALVTIPAGWAVDRVNRTRLLRFAVLGWGAAVLGSGIATGYAFLLVAQLVLGALTAVAGPAVASLVGDYFAPRERSRIYSYIITGELIGTGLGLIVAGDLAAITWRAAFLIFAPTAVGVWWLVRSLPEPPRGMSTGVDPDSETDDGSDESIWSAFRHILGVRTNIVLIATSALGYFFFAGIRGFGVVFTTHQYGLHQTTATALVPALGIGAVGGVLVAGRVADRLLGRGFRAARIVVAGAALVASALLVMPALLTRSVVEALPLLIAAAACLGAVNPPLDAARLDIMPPRLWGRAESVRTVLRTGGEAAAPLTFGFLASRVFTGPTALRNAFVVMVLPLIAAGAVMLLWGRRTYPGDVAQVRVKEQATVPEPLKAAS